LFNPLQGNGLPSNIVQQLEGRMIMIGFNVKNSSKLPFDDPIVPFFQWLGDLPT